MSTLPTGYVCIYRPNRTRDRVFSKRDAARIYCRVATREPFPLEEFQELVTEYCPGVRVKPEPDWERRLRDAIDILEAILKFILAVVGQWKRIKTVLQRVIKYLPPSIRRAVERIVAEGVALIEETAKDIVTRAREVIDTLIRLISSRAR